MRGHRPGGALGPARGRRHRLRRRLLPGARPGSLGQAEPGAPRPRLGLLRPRLTARDLTACPRRRVRYAHARTSPAAGPRAGMTDASQSRPSGPGVDAPMSVTVEASHDSHGADQHGEPKAKAGFWALALGSVGRRLRRHRHQPALRPARGAAPRPGGRRHPRGGAGRHLAPALGADLHRHRQVRPVPDARRQSRRGRHAVADGAGPARAGPVDAGGVPPGRRRCGPVLRRRPDHARRSRCSRRSRA